MLGWPAPASCEYLAVTQTIQENQEWQGSFYKDRRTGIRYYTLIAPSGTSTVPVILYGGDFYDTNTSGSLYYWMPSNAVDSDQNVVYTFNIGDGTSNYPSVYADTLDEFGNPGTLTSVQAGSASITDPANHSWGEFLSVSMDPSDDLTFWATGEYLTSAETACSGTNGTSGCTWLTTVFSCQKGLGVCP